MSKTVAQQIGGQKALPAIATGIGMSVDVGDRTLRRDTAPLGEQPSRPVIESGQHPFCNFISRRFVTLYAQQNG
jgi:hypothetical protein